MAALATAALAGLATEDIAALNPDQVAALTASQVGVLTTAQGILSGNYLITASKEALDDPTRLAAIGDYVRRYRKVFDWINSDGVRWARVRAQATGVSQAYYEQEFRERSTASILEPISDAAIASQQAVADTFAAAKVIPARVEVKSLWDDRLTPYLK